MRRPGQAPAAAERARAAEGLLDRVVGDDREDARDERRGDEAEGREASPVHAREDNDRPVPEVPGVGDLAQVVQWHSGQQPDRARGGGRGAGDDHGDRRPDREQGAPAGIGGRAAEDDRGRGEDNEAAAGQQRRDGAWHAHPERQHEGEDAAGGELPDPGQGREVGGARIGRGEGEAVGEGGQGQRHDEERDRGAQAHPQPPRAERGEAEQQRPGEVELLLDRERPVVLHRAGQRLFEGEVVDRLGDEVPVDEVERRGEHVGGHLLALGRREQRPRRDHGEGQHDHRQGQQALGPAGVEAADRERAAALDLGQDQAGDQKAGEHVEDVEPDVAAAGTGQAGVAGEDEDQGEAPDPLDVEAKPIAGPRPGYGLCGSIPAHALYDAQARRTQTP